MPLGRTCSRRLRTPSHVKRLRSTAAGTLRILWIRPIARLLELRVRLRFALLPLFFWQRIAAFEGDLVLRLRFGKCQFLLCPGRSLLRPTLGLGNPPLTFLSLLADARACLRRFRFRLACSLLGFGRLLLSFAPGLDHF